MDELNKLESYLKEKGIKYERTDRDDGDESESAFAYKAAGLQEFPVPVV